jgi:hypothetical protein
MKERSQAELMEEGFWNTFKWGAGKVKDQIGKEYSVLKNISRTVAPDIHEPLSKLNNILQPEPVDSRDRIDDEEAKDQRLFKNIAKTLKSQGYTISAKHGMRKSGRDPKTGRPAYTVLATDDATHERVMATANDKANIISIEDWRTYRRNHPEAEQQFSQEQPQPDPVAVSTPPVNPQPQPAAATTTPPSKTTPKPNPTTKKPAPTKKKASPKKKAAPAKKKTTKKKTTKKKAAPAKKKPIKKTKKSTNDDRSRMDYGGGSEDEGYAKYFESFMKSKEIFDFWTK